jgi:hypothetical protein
MRHASTLLAAALLAGCGQPLLSAQLEIPEIRITSPAKSFPATNPTPVDLCALLPGCIKADISYDLGAEVPVFEEKGIDFDLRLTDVALRLVTDPDPLSTATGPADLSGVESVRVSLHDPSGAGTMLVASYTKPPGATPRAIAVSGNSNLDLAPFLSAGTISARIEIDYDTTNPPPDFFADIEAGFSLVATVRYDAYF